MLSNKSSFGFWKLNLGAIALGLLMCVPGFANSIGGSVYYGLGSVPYIPDTDVCAYQSGVVIVCDTTDANGAYELTGLGSGPYDVCATKPDGDDANHIDSADSSAVQAHVLSTAPFPNNFTGSLQKWAADTSCNLAITSFDAAKIDNWAGTHNSYGCTGQWRFLAGDNRSVPWPGNDGAMPGPTPTPNSAVCYHHASLPIDQGDEFIGILKGEVTGDWVYPQ
jgi:hypothetical protein